MCLKLKLFGHYHSTTASQLIRYLDKTGKQIKSVIDRDDATCRNNNCLQTDRQRLWTDNGKCVWICVSCVFYAELGSVPVQCKIAQAGEHGQTNRQMDRWTDGQTHATKRIISRALRSIMINSTTNGMPDLVLEIWKGQLLIYQSSQSCQEQPSFDNFFVKK